MRRFFVRLVNLVPVVALALAAGCPGTNVINTGNFPVSFQVGATNGGGVDAACVQVALETLRLRVVDGNCPADAFNAGEPCGTLEDCVGTCQGSPATSCLTDAGCGANGPCRGRSCPGGVASPFFRESISVVETPGIGNINFVASGGACNAVNPPTSGASLPQIVLSPNRYRIVNYSINSPTLVDSQGNEFACGTLEDLATSLGPLIFRVGETEPNAVRLVLDVQQFANVIDPQTGCDIAALRANLGSIFLFQ